LSVPVSYSKPGGAQIPISVIELPAARPHPIGDIVFNPGGPGASGVQFLERAWHNFPASLRARFTLVSFDPRGVGASEPLQCSTPAEIMGLVGLNPAPRTARQVKAVVGATKAFVRGCEQNASSAFISSMSTANTARDMDRLRVALGQTRLTYFGFSYGTYLGTVYAEMFPKRIRAMILDGAVDPALDNYTVEAEQAAGFETELHHFFAWSPEYASRYAALMAGYKLSFRWLPAYLPELGDREERVDYGTALVAVRAGLYSKETWPDLGLALRSANANDASVLASFAYHYAGENADGSFSNVLSAGTATSCLDWPAPTTIRAYKTLASRLARVAPDFGAAEAWSTLACAYWPTRAALRPVPAHAPGAPPILVIGSTGDPATPYAWAKALAKQLPRATLLTRQGSGHTAYWSSFCIRSVADRYLRTLWMPPPGVVCPSD
jgi:pimeloyl-ACP methyl ester carboxylesterase